MRNPKINGLYAITPELENTIDLLDKTRQVLEGGAQLIQYRNKSANKVLLREQAGLLLQLCRAYRVPLIINDYLDLVIEIDADGLHVGQQDASLLHVRNQLGCNKIVGASCYNNLDLALQAEKEGADYVAFGAFFPSLTKPNTVSVTVNLIGETKQKITIPIVGIGGIRLTNAREVIQSGCAAIAVCNDLFQSENIKVKAAQYAQLFAET
ncbi:thiamine phosphate synthase [Nitrosomonas sp.]|uniref:thiamine phosphate synthase n=1 Tax=Nitrosomonas sp. TaxID=42353 RepID=UPI0025E816E5|nr:thiamine phosphate synthase [Nitrosomonas sp.]